MVYPVLKNEEMATESQQYICFTRNGGNAIPKHAGGELKVAILPLDLPCSGPVTHSGEISITGKSHGKNPDRFSLNDDMDMGGGESSEHKMCLLIFKIIFVWNFSHFEKN